MAKKNSKASIKKRMSVIKNDFMINNKKKEHRRELKVLQNQVKSQLIKLNLGLSNGANQIPEFVLDTKAKRQGINFSRSIDSTRPLRARDKKIIQRALKRKKRLTMEIN